MQAKTSASHSHVSHAYAAGPARMDFVGAPRIISLCRPPA